MAAVAAPKLPSNVIDPTAPVPTMQEREQARIETGRKARERQRFNKPPREPHVFAVAVVSKDGTPVVEKITALYADEAWALFCDKRQHWPSPTGVTRVIRDLGPVSTVAASTDGGNSQAEDTLSRLNKAIAELSA